MDCMLCDKYAKKLLDLNAMKGAIGGISDNFLVEVRVKVGDDFKER